MYNPTCPCFSRSLWQMWPNIAQDNHVSQVLSRTTIFELSKLFQTLFYFLWQNFVPFLNENDVGYVFMVPVHFIYLHFFYIEILLMVLGFIVDYVIILLGGALMTTIVLSTCSVSIYKSKTKCHRRESLKNNAWKDHKSWAPRVSRVSSQGM